MQELVTWAGAIASLLGFALAFGVHPALYGATADMLARGGNYGLKLGSLLGGLIIGAIGMFFLLRVFNPLSFLTLVKHDVSDAVLNRWVDLAAGIGFLVIGAVIASWRLLKPVITPKPITLPGENTAVFGYCVIGIGSACIGFTTWPLMYLVSRVISTLSDDRVLRGIAFALFLFALIAPFLFLAWAWSRFPVTAKRISSAYSKALGADYRWSLAAIFFLGGAFLIVLSFLHHGR